MFATWNGYREHTAPEPQSLGPLQHVPWTEGRGCDTSTVAVTLALATGVAVAIGADDDGDADDADDTLGTIAA